MQLKIEKIIKQSFAVIGKEGSTKDGVDFIKHLWADANMNFSEISPLIKYGDDNAPVGIWGVMSDFSRSFLPFGDDFSKGWYLAGAECDINVAPPNGWHKWIIPSYEYICIENDGENIFAEGIAYLNENKYELVGAVHELTIIKIGKNYLYFPIKRI